jgi:hypothetical protein
MVGILELFGYCLGYFSKDWVKFFPDLLVTLAVQASVFGTYNHYFPSILFGNKQAN